MNIQKIFTRKKIQKFLKKFVFSLLIAVFFVGGISPLYSMFSGNPEISGTESAYADSVEGSANAGAGANAGATTSASSGTTATTKTWQEQAQSGEMGIKLKQKIAEFSSLMISIFTPIIAILVKLIESLMSDSYIMGVNGNDSGIPIAQVLYELWLVFRDIMNYLFILILLFFAFMNVIAPIADNDNFALKTILPKMIMAIVVINLTWFGARVVFDVVDVSARVVFGLPQAIMDTTGGSALNPKDNPCIVSAGEGTNKFAGIKGLCDAAYVNLNTLEKKNCTKTIDGKVYTKGSCFYFEPKGDEPGCENPIKGYFPPTCNTYKTEVVPGEGEKGAFSALFTELNTKKTKVCTEDAKKKDISECKNVEAKIKRINKIIQQGGLKKAVNYGPITVYWRDFNYERFNQGTIAPLFAFSIMQIQNLPRIAKNQHQELTKEGTGWSTLVINILVSLVIMIILLVLFALMVVNLFFRVIVLWINIIFSPFYGLLIFKEQLGLDGAESEYLGLSAFIKHAFAPVIMGLPLVVGFIMITVGKQYGVIEEGGNFGIDTPMIDNVSNLHQLFYYVMAIVVLWVGGVKAIEATSSEFVNSTFISPIKDGVTSAAKFVATAPMYINFIPVAGKDGAMHDMNLKQLSNMSGDIGRLRDQRSSRERQEIMGGSDATKYTTNYSTQIKNVQRNDSDKAKAKEILETLSKSGGANNIESKMSLLTQEKDFKALLSGITNTQEAQALLGAMGADASLQKAEILLEEAKKVPGVGTVKTPKTDEKDKKEDEDKKDGKTNDVKKTKTPEPVSERKIDEVIGKSQKYLKKTSSTTFDEKKKYTVNIINTIGENADKYEKESDKKKYIKEMMQELKKKVLGKNDNETEEIYAMIDEIAKQDIKKISTISVTDAEKLIPDDKKSS